MRNRNQPKQSGPSMGARQRPKLLGPHEIKALLDAGEDADNFRNPFWLQSRGYELTPAMAAGIRALVSPSAPEDDAERTSEALEAAKAAHAARPQVQPPIPCILRPVGPWEEQPSHVHVPGLKLAVPPMQPRRKPVL